MFAFLRKYLQPEYGQTITSTDELFFGEELNARRAAERAKKVIFFLDNFQSAFACGLAEIRDAERGERLAQGAHVFQAAVSAGCESGFAADGFEVVHVGRSDGDE